jgi:hypothetical protein
MQVVFEPELILLEPVHHRWIVKLNGGLEDDEECILLADGVGLVRRREVREFVILRDIMCFLGL